MPWCAGLAEDLLPRVEPLVDSGGPVTEELRAACEEVVAKWVGKMRGGRAR